MSKIVFNIATLERRKASFIKVLCCLANQTVKCDIINIAASYSKPDEEVLDILKMKFSAHTIRWGGFTAIEKMYALEYCSADTYFFSMDDDIEYPVDYIETLIKGIDARERKCVVGFHGKSFKTFPVKNYYDDTNRSVYQYYKPVIEDKPVHIIGTGVCGFYTQTLFDKGLTHNEVFKEGLKRGFGNYNDVIFSKYLRDNGIPMVVLKHERNWIKIIPGTQDAGALWVQKKAKGRKIELSFLQS